MLAHRLLLMLLCVSYYYYLINSMLLLSCIIFHSSIASSASKSSPRFSFSPTSSPSYRLPYVTKTVGRISQRGSPLMKWSPAATVVLADTKELITTTLRLHSLSGYFPKHPNLTNLLLFVKSPSSSSSSSSLSSSVLPSPPPPHSSTSPPSDPSSLQPICWPSSFNPFNSSSTKNRSPPSCASSVLSESGLAPVRRDIREARLKFQKHASMMSNTSHYKDGSLLAACRGEAVEHVPVWMMRQAGRYLPEFREIRSKYEFIHVCSDPELASEVTIQPLKRFKQLNAVIIFSDILVIPKAMGQNVKMVSGVGPVMDWSLDTPEDIHKKLNLSPDVESTLGYVFDAIYLTKEKLQASVPVIGFCGAPFTLMCYMVEGQSSKTWAKAKRWLYEYPEASHKLLGALASVAAEFLIKQYDAGAPVLQVFDTHAGVLTPSMYEEFGAAYMQKIADEVKRRRPKSVLIGFPKDRTSQSFVNSAFDVIGLSWGDNPVEMREKFGKKKALQGNLDPHVLYASPEVIRKETIKMVRAFGKKGYIANLGHGMEPEMDPEHAKTFIQAVKDAF
eukprot:GHVS01073831.1.p1 GENE.GHVS01073831.1~~GHVS01073831.1.p1  ORF type:complete len:560 (+),score=86.64 GHVS01073831.1:68-1747(+)